jgi:hypothetical protein
MVQRDYMDEQTNGLRKFIKGADEPEQKFKPKCSNDLQQDKTLAEMFKEYVFFTTNTSHSKIIPTAKSKKCARTTKIFMTMPTTVGQLEISPGRTRKANLASHGVSFSK